jgi:hypothetical protein
MYIFSCAILIPYQIENLSLKTLQMEEVGKFFSNKMSETYHMSLKRVRFLGGKVGHAYIFSP